MFDTVQALGVALVALLPGATYTYAYERGGGAYGVNRSDRLIRFLTASAAFQAAFSGLTYYVYQHAIQAHQLSDGRVRWWVVELAAIGYFAIPTLLGLLVGHGKSQGWEWVRKLVGTAEPRAWDHVWSRKPIGVARLHLKSGIYVAGAFVKRADGVHSYAAGYPEDQDLFFAQAVAVDADTGEFIADTGGRMRFMQSGLLVRWDEVQHLELFEFPEEAAGND